MFTILLKTAFLTVLYRLDLLNYSNLSKMAGQGHQFPGNFQSNTGAMRTGFGAGPMGGQMQSMSGQLAGTFHL